MGLAQGWPFLFSKVGDEYRLTLEATTAFYYGFQHTDDLLQPFVTVEVALGDDGPTFGLTPAVGERRGFFRAKVISISAPEDQDNDLMDDYWELRHPLYLNPFYPNDAFLPSPEADSGGLSNLNYYFGKRGTVRLNEVFTREVSMFNFGASTAGVEAISRSISIFNGASVPTSGIPEHYSREVSLFNFGADPAAREAISRAVSAFNGANVPTSGLAEVYSREASLYNFGSDPAGTEAVSRLVSLFNGQNAPASGLAEVYSREASAFNFGSDPAGREAIARAISIYNGETPPGAGGLAEVYTREASLFNFGSDPARVEAISRAAIIRNSTTP
jgi:hypothetical protein